jgi:hypothetical protein
MLWRRDLRGLHVIFADFILSNTLASHSNIHTCTRKSNLATFPLGIELNAGTLKSSTRILGVGMSRVSLPCIVCSMAQMPLTRTSQAGTFATSTILLACSLAPANHQLVCSPPFALIALPIPPLAPESTYRAETIAHQSSFLLITSDGRSP